MDVLEIKSVKKNKNKINYEYVINGKWKEYLIENQKLFIEYNIDISSVPDGILYIPLLCNILPISWIFNLKIKVDELDNNFYSCIQDLKKGYQNMYPNIKFLGEIEVAKITENTYTPNKNGALFSGGVDAFSTLFSHIDEKPTLLTLWGADIKLDDQEGWEKVKKHHIDTANQFGLEFLFAKTNFREFLVYNNLSKYVRNFTNDEWWHGFQHGIGILGHIAPIAYMKKFKNIYIASSFTAEYRGKYTCASDPTIDNYLKFGNCNVIHDGYEYNRQDKIHNICNYLNEKGIENVSIRVCWESKGGENCCTCEKCCRTILGIIAEKENPNNYGFELNEKKRAYVIKKLNKYAKYSASRYVCIQNRLKQNYSEKDMPEDLIKFRKLKIKEKAPQYIVVFNKAYRIIEKIAKKIKK